MQTNNKMREALKDIGRLVEQIHFLYSDYPSEIHEIARKVNAALAEPVKNNEVGTVEKQAARHHAWCRRHGINGDNKVDCAHPDMSCDLCTLRWAQMPYEAKEGVAK